MKEEIQKAVWAIYDAVGGLSSIEFKYVFLAEDPNGKECVYEVIFLDANYMQARRGGNLFSYYER